MGGLSKLHLHNRILTRSFLIGNLKRVEMKISSGPLRILIVEDHSLLIDGICSLLGKNPHYEVVGTVSNGLSVYESCQQLSPDLILLDLSLPGMDGIDIIYQLLRRWEKMRIVVITASSEEHRCHKAIAAGAMAYVLKQSSQQTLLGAIQCAAVGKKFIDPSLRLDTMESATSSSKEVTLTMRERQILKLVAEGKRNRDIAELLSISLKTVETHRLNLMRKLDAHNAAELSRWARRLGVLEF